jgi:TRAP-type transport system large permease protein
MGFVILAVMGLAVGLMLLRVLPTAFMLVLLGIAIALLGGAPLLTGSNDLLTTVLEEGSVMLASTMAAVVIGSWLGQIMDDTGIAATLIRKTVELGGERPYGVALAIFLVGLMVGTVTGSAPAAMLVGIIGIPTMIAIGVPPTTAAGTVVFGLAAGIPFDLITWQYLSDTLGIGIDTIKDFYVYLFPIVAVIGATYVLLQSRRTGLRHTWAATATDAVDTGNGDAQTPTVRDAPWYALPTPLLPIVLALLVEVPIIPSLLAGVLYALVTTTPPRRLPATAMRTLLACFSVAVPPLLLFAAIGILLAAVSLPGTVDALAPIVSSIIPTNPWLFVLALAPLAPLALYRGPFNVYGMGAGLAAILISSGGYAPPVALGVMASYNQVLGVSDPTSTQTVWSAQFSGVRPEKVMLQTLPYTWLVAIGGLILTAARFL